MKRAIQKWILLLGVFVSLSSSVQAAETSYLRSRFDVPLSTLASNQTATDGWATNHQDLLNLLAAADDVEARLGATNEAAAATDTATSGLNGLVKRLLQRLTTLISFYAADFGAAAGAIRTAAQIGNATGAADYGAGAPTAQTLRTASATHDGSGNAITSRSYASVRPVDVFLPQLGANTVTYTRTTLSANVSTQIIAANAARKWLYIDNQSGANVFVKFGAAAVINQALEVPNNSTFKMSVTELYYGAINAIVGSNNRTVEVVEGY